MKNILLIAIITISTLTSCDIQKKRYSRGFTISKNRNYISSIKKSKDLKTNQNSEISKISYPIISKINQEPVITNIVIENKVAFANKNEEKLEIVTIHKPEKKQISSKLMANSKSKAFDKSNIKRNQSNKANDPDTPKKPINKNSIIALLFFLLPIIGFLVAHIFAFKALKQIKESPNKYRKPSKTLAIIASIPFYILLFYLIILTIGLSIYNGFFFILLTLTLLLIAILPILYLNSLNLEANINDETDPIKPKPEEKLQAKKKRSKKSISNSNKLLIFFILLFSSMLLIPIALN